MNFRTGTIASLVAAGVLSAAIAQASSADQHPFRVDVGAIWPSSSTLTDTTSRSALFGGLSYDFYSSGMGMNNGESPNYASVYSDAYYTSGNGLHLTAVGIGLEDRMYFSNGTTTMSSSSTAGGIYAGVGAGVYFLNSNFTTSSNNTRGGGKVFLGYEMSSGVFGEVGYDFIGSVDGTTLSGFHAVIGFRF